MDIQNPCHVAFRRDSNCDEKIVFFSKEAIDRAVREGRVPVEDAEPMKEILDRPNEIVVVYERRVMSDEEKRICLLESVVRPDIKKSGH